MFKTMAAIGLAAVVAGAMTGYPDFVGSVSASAPTADTPVLAAPACPERGWPYQNCNTLPGKPQIRLISTDRLN